MLLWGSPFHNVSPTDPWAWEIVPSSDVLFNFILQCLRVFNIQVFHFLGESYPKISICLLVKLTNALSIVLIFFKLQEPILWFIDYLYFCFVFLVQWLKPWISFHIFFWSINSSCSRNSRCAVSYKYENSQIFIK